MHSCMNGGKKMKRRGYTKRGGGLAVDPGRRGGVIQDLGPAGP